MTYNLPPRMDPGTDNGAACPAYNSVRPEDLHLALEDIRHAMSASQNKSSRQLKKIAQRKRNQKQQQDQEQQHFQHQHQVQQNLISDPSTALASIIPYPVPIIHPIQPYQSSTSLPSFRISQRDITSNTLQLPYPTLPPRPLIPMSDSDEKPSLTPTTKRLSKAKKGKRVHQCDFPGCTKVCWIRLGCWI
jgi:DNA-binding transcriptional MerR regulator